MLDAIPPTQGALLQHSLRTLYQGGHIWGQSTIIQPIYPDPSTFGSTKEGGTFRPLWSTLPSAAVSCDEIISCACKTSCKGQCKCLRAALPCTTLCACDGECVTEESQNTIQVVQIRICDTNPYM